ncbi:MAG: glycosyltransferase family A protein [Sphingomonas sp.]
MSISAEKTSCGDGTPLFSVVIPSYNRPHLVVRAASSVLRQTFPCFELIIVNDGSLRSYAGVLDELNDPRARLVDSSENKGAASARNVGIRRSRGKYIAFLDDDDEYLESYLETTLSTLGPTGGNVALSWCGVEWVDQTDPATSESRTEEYPIRFTTDKELFEEFMSIGTGFGVCVKSECFARVGGFDESLKTVEDTDWFIRVLSSAYRPVVTPGVHLRIYNHDSGERLTGRNTLETRLRECEYLLKKHEPFLAQHESLRGMVRHRIRELQLKLTFAEPPQD